MSSDRSAAGRRQARDLWLWLAVGLSLVASLTPWAGYLLYPFRILTTWVHECGHAAMALAVGGSVHAITIRPDGSGLAENLIPDGRVARGLVASAGYLGASVVGCLLIAGARLERWARAILWTLGACMLVTGILWVRNLFGVVVVLAWAGVLVLLAPRARHAAARFVLGLVAIQLALNAVFDIRVLFLSGIGPSDARTMAELFLLPSWVWAGAWMIVSVGMLGGTLWVTRPRGGRA